MQKNLIFLFFSIFLLFATNSACASTTQLPEIENPPASTSTALAPNVSTTVTTTTTTSIPVFLIPTEGESFEAVIQLCDLASNSLQCEEECFTNDSNLAECVDEAEEIISAQKPQKDLGSDLPATSIISSSASSENTGTLDEETEKTTPTAAENAYKFLGSYSFSDNKFGTQITVDVNESVRSIASNALPNHTTGDFPNSGNPNAISEQDVIYEFTTEPVYTGSSTEVLTTGVAINGVKFEPGTAESISCASGEFYRIEALQETYNLGLDSNNAHVQPTGEYHYHGVSRLLIDVFSTETDLVHIGFAADGFLIYYSNSGAYESGYELKTEPRTGTDCLATGPAGGNMVSISETVPDGTYTSDWVHIGEDGKLDECNGVHINGEYMYLLTETFPYIPRCLNGQVSASTVAGGPPPKPPQPRIGPPPDLTSVAETLGVDLSDLISALGPPPPDLESAALKLDVPLSKLQSLMPRPG
ncbi:MAG: Uncharacterised protein [Acidimicrobiaceae bacterium]|nr:MAG: Uncharacterised protein [Acidimicrobiaceae bacterium]